MLGVVIRRRWTGCAARAALLLGVVGGPAAAQGIPTSVLPSIAAVEMARSNQLTAYSLPESPDVFIFDFPSLEQQGQMFNRVVAMIERQGAPHQRVLTDQELADLIRSVGKRAATFAFGNDFRVSELVKFYNLADEGNIQLNPEELRLRSFLEANGFMKVKFGFVNWVPPDKVILSIPQEEGPDGPDRLTITHTVRNAILRHEISHGEFYANDDYAAYCERFWSDVMTEPQRKAFRAFLAGKGYDQGDEELMINETQAYLIHTPDPAIFSATKVKLKPEEVDGLRGKFWAGNPPSTLFRTERRGAQ